MGCFQPVRQTFLPAAYPQSTPAVKGLDGRFAESRHARTSRSAHTGLRLSIESQCHRRYDCAAVSPCYKHAPNPLDACRAVFAPVLQDVRPLAVRGAVAFPVVDQFRSCGGSRFCLLQPVSGALCRRWRVSGLPFRSDRHDRRMAAVAAPSPAKIEAALQALAAMPDATSSPPLSPPTRPTATSSPRSRQGADWVIDKNGRSALVSHQRWKAANHGVEPLRELAAALASAAGSDAGQGLYIALNAPSDAARQFAVKNSIRIVTGTELAQLMGPTITAGSNGKRAV